MLISWLWCLQIVLWIVSQIFNSNWAEKKDFLKIDERKAANGDVWLVLVRWEHQHPGHKKVLGWGEEGEESVPMLSQDHHQPDTEEEWSQDSEEEVCVDTKYSLRKSKKYLYNFKTFDFH